MTKTAKELFDGTKVLFEAMRDSGAVFAFCVMFDGQVANGWSGTEQEVLGAVESVKARHQRHMMEVTPNVELTGAAPHERKTKP